MKSVAPLSRSRGFFGDLDEPRWSGDPGGVLNAPSASSAASSPSCASSNFPRLPSASFNAQNRKKAIALRQTSSGAVGELVNAMRQFTQSVNVVASVSVMCSN